MSDSVERKISGITVKIERMSCIGTANCIKVAPEIFELDDENICAFKEPPAEKEEEIIKEACSVCPVNALYVFDKEGKQVVP
jgi:ferredoxin